MRLKLIACEILYREICYLTAQSPHCIDLLFLPKGLHDIGSEKMRDNIQQAIHQTELNEKKYDYILLGYALCNNGIVGVKAEHTPLIIPKAHDCITFFFGSREKYKKYFETHPGTYFLTTGWIERDETHGELKQISIQTQTGMNMTYDELVEKYGEDNAEFLYETLCDPEKNYSQYTYIYMGIEDRTLFEQKARKMAEGKKWKFEIVQGDLSLLKKLIYGEWREHEFLTVNPGEQIIASYQEKDILIDRVRISRASREPQVYSLSHKRRG